MIPIALQKKWSEESVKKLNDFISPVTLLRVMVEIAAVTDVGFFCETTYILEGDDALGCCCWMVFEKIDSCMEDAIKPNKVTLNVCDKAGEMANELLVKLQSKRSSKVAETEQVICQLQQTLMI